MCLSTKVECLFLADIKKNDIFDAGFIIPISLIL
jgi:hypothetical protein